MPASRYPLALRRASIVALGLAALCRPASADAETDLVKAALAHGGFKAFVGLVSRAGLADTLGQSPVTVFMPTDAAFARLSAAQRKSIADLSPDGVRDFVGRFVFPGTAMTSNDVDKTITSASGTSFDVTWYKGRLSLRDERGPATSRLAYVVQGDIPAGSGMIDAVDGVLMPAAAGGTAFPTAAKASDGGEPSLDGSKGLKTEAAKSDAAGPKPNTAVPGTPAPTPVPVPATTTPAPAVSFVRPAPSEVAPAAVPAAVPVAVPAAVPARPATAAPMLPAATPSMPEASVSAGGLRGWPLKVSGTGSTGKVNGVMIGLPDGRVIGLSAHFGGFLGLGGRSVYVPWDRVTPDAKGHVLRARLTAAEFAAAPAGPPKP